MDINLYHKAMGHIHEQALVSTAKAHNITLTGNLTQCVACLKAKYKTHPLNKVTTRPSTHPGERIHLDISSIKSPSIGGATFWALFVDDFSKFK